MFMHTICILNFHKQKKKENYVSQYFLMHLKSKHVLNILQPMEYYLLFLSKSNEFSRDELIEK